MFEVVMTLARIFQILKIHRKSRKKYDYNFFTSVLRTKRTFLTAKKKIRG